MARRIAIGNNKGGVGKSTDTVRLAEALAKAGHRVGVAEMDPQGNASRRLGVRLGPGMLTMADALKSAAEGVAAQVWQPCGWDAPYASNIAVLPANFTLEDRAPEAGERGAYRRLWKVLKGADDHLDYLLIDCQPSLGHLTDMALAASHVAVSATEAEFDSLEAAIRFRDFIALVRDDLGNPELEFVGVIVNAFDQRVGSQVDQLANTRERFGEQVWGVVPQRALLADADAGALPLSAMAGSNEVRAVFELLGQRLVKEVPA